MIRTSCKRKRHYLEERPYHWIGFKVSVVAVSDSTGTPSASTDIERTRRPTLVRLTAREQHVGNTASFQKINLEEWSHTLEDLSFQSEI